MLERIDVLAARRESFAFETTLASRSLARFLRRQRHLGYEIHLAYVWIPNADMAVERVRERQRRGGHQLDDETVRRRYERGLRNFVDLYASLADSWTLCDDSAAELKLVALGGKDVRTIVVWKDGKVVYLQTKNRARKKRAKATANTRRREPTRARRARPASRKGRRR